MYYIVHLFYFDLKLFSDQPFLYYKIYDIRFMLLLLLFLNIDARLFTNLKSISKDIS